MRTGRTHVTRNPAVADLPVGDPGSSPEGGTHAACAADVTGADPSLPDGVVDERDRDAFMRLWSEGAARADLDNGAGYGVQDGVVDDHDYDYFMSLYAAQCRR